MGKFLFSAAAVLVGMVNLHSQQLIHKNIKFDFQVIRPTDKAETIEVKGTLYNPNLDAIYFLTGSCDAMYMSLKYDTSKFRNTHPLMCNINLPIIARIEPSNKIDFTTEFQLKGQYSKIKLGFDFFEVDKSFNIETLPKKELNIFRRKEKDQNILWADIHRFE